MATKKIQIKPFFAYAGGKSTMAKHILPLIPPHICYVEPFFGSGVIFWKKDQAKVSVINDLNHEVVNFWRIVGTKLDELIAELKLTLYSRYEFERATKIRRECKQYNELQRAWAFFVSQNQSFGAKLNNFGTSKEHGRTSNAYYNKIQNIEELKELIKDKLEGCEYSDLERAWAFFVSQNQCFGANSSLNNFGTSKEHGRTSNAYYNKIENIEELKEQIKDKLDGCEYSDLEQAWAFFVSQNQAYNGRGDGNSWMAGLDGRSETQPNNFQNKIENIEQLKEQIKQKLDGCEYSDLEQAWAFFVSQNQCFGSVARQNNWAMCNTDLRLNNNYNNKIQNIEELKDLIKDKLEGCEYSDLEQAWAFFVSQNQCFGGKDSNTWGYRNKESDGGTNRYHNKIKNIEEFIDIIKTRVKKTFIECRPAVKVIKQFDGADTFHFLDPPYIGTEQTQYKGNEYNKDDMIELLELCATLQGKFILTHYDNPLIREHAEKNKWTVKEVTRTSSVANAKAGAKARPKKTELIVMNYNNELF